MTGVDKILAKAKDDPQIVAVFLFGSRARGESAAGSDVDVCLMLKPGKHAASTLSLKRLSYLKQSDADVYIFSQLPLYIRHRVLKDGKVLLFYAWMRTYSMKSPFERRRPLRTLNISTTGIWKRLPVLARDRILVKLDQLYGYLGELREVLPEDFTLYRKVERKRACERLLQVSIEAVIDICHLLVAGLRLGIAAEEDDLFDKLKEATIISFTRTKRSRHMRLYK